MVRAGTLFMQPLSESSKRTCFFVAMVTYALSIASMCAGCAWSARTPPTVDTPAEWRAQKVGGSQIYEPAWWNNFGDVTVRTLAQRALETSPDVVASNARISSAEALLHSRGASLYPTLAGAVSGSRVFQASNAPFVPGVGPVTQGDSQYTNFFVGQLSAAYEVDLFGRVRTLSDAALASYQATIEEERSARIGLVSSIFSAYVELRRLDYELDLRNKQRGAYQALVEIARLRKSRGAITATTQHVVEQELSEFDLGTTERFNRRQGLSDSLAVLVGEVPESFSIPSDAQALDALSVPVPPIEVPGCIIQKRPDVQRAARELESQSKVALATSLNFLPRLSLVGTIGRTGSSFSEFLNHPARFWDVGPGITLPFFEGGRLQAERDLENAQEKVAETHFVTTVLKALAEVEQELRGNSLAQSQLEQASRGLAIAKEVYEQAALAVKLGKEAKQHQITQELSLGDANLTRISARASVVLAALRLHQVLGADSTVECK